MATTLKKMKGVKRKEGGKEKGLRVVSYILELAK